MTYHDKPVSDRVRVGVRPRDRMNAFPREYFNQRPPRHNAHFYAKFSATRLYKRKISGYSYGSGP
jgi:hypothetical protein